MLHVWFTSMAGVAYISLIIDQIPKSRSTLMSLNRMFNSLGETIAPAMGGGIYGSIGLVHAGLTFVGLIILHLYAKDPTEVQG